MKPGAALVLCGWALACGRETGIGPPVLHLGQDTCDACAMAISDERPAAATIVEDGNGERRVHRFDDIGCMLTHEAAQGGERPLARFVHDFAGGGWLDAETAHYLSSSALPTPMLYGLAAFRTVERAEQERSERGGVIVDLDWLRLRASAGELKARTPAEPGERLER